MATRKKQSFEAAMTRLEEIVTTLEQGNGSLEESMALFAEGSKLSAAMRKQLDTAEQQVLRITQQADNTLQEEPIPEDA